jgi:Nitronate monooxygenase
MAFIATAPLVRAVCKAGGMGMLGSPAMPPDALQAAIRHIKAVDPACFGIDIIAWFSGIEHIEVCATEKVPVVVFFWDDAPDEWLSRLRAAGSHIWFQVGSVDEAKAALRRGGQGLVVQGSEAGGHNRAAAATFSLLPAVIDAVPSVPVVAAGGIADGRTVAAALALGADAVWVGTRLLASFEAYAHPQYKDQVVAAGVEYPPHLTTRAREGSITSLHSSPTSNVVSGVGDIRSPRPWKPSPRGRKDPKTTSMNCGLRSHSGLPATGFRVGFRHMRQDTKPHNGGQGGHSVDCDGGRPPHRPWDSCLVYPYA